MPDYLYTIRPKRPEFFRQPTEQEEQLMAEHFIYLKNATQAGTVLLAGPCLDETFGIVVFQAENEAQARRFMEDDPSVRGGVQIAELHPFKASLIRKV